MSWDFIQPGKPTENAYVESFSGWFRDECLNENTTLAHARQKIEEWRQDYNQQHPHSALGYPRPREFANMAAVTSGGKDAGCARLENAPRFPLSHSSDGCCIKLSNRRNSHYDWYKHRGQIS